MSTILPHGVIQIDEGNTSWYNDITDNWQLIDGKIGEYDAAIATIPAAANDGTLTITVNGTTAGTFTANQVGNSIIDIPASTVPEFATNAEIDALTAEWHL